MIRILTFAAFLISCFPGALFARDAAFLPPELTSAKKEAAKKEIKPPPKEEIKAAPPQEILKAPPKEIKPISFGAAQLGDRVARATMLVNDSGEPITIRSIEMIEADNGLQRLDQGCTIGKPIPPGGSCPVILQWEPKKAGALSTDLVIHHSGRVGFTVIAVRGEAKERPPEAVTPPALVVAPAAAPAPAAPPAPVPAATPAPPPAPAAAQAPAPAPAPPQAAAPAQPQLVQREIVVSTAPDTPPPAPKEMKKEPVAPLPAPLVRKEEPRKEEPRKATPPKSKKSAAAAPIDIRLVGTVGDRAAVFMSPEGDTCVIPVGGTVQLKQGAAKLAAVTPYAAELVVNGQERVLHLKAPAAQKQAKPAKYDKTRSAQKKRGR